MTDIVKFVACTVATLIGMLVFTQYDGGESVTQIMGYPIVQFDGEPEALIAIGGFGKGVLVFGMGGFGVICFTLYGAGILFATGQLAGGLIALGQCGVGLAFFIGQAGIGLNALAQVALGARVYTGDNDRRLPYFSDMKGELAELFKAPNRRG